MAESNISVYSSIYPGAVKTSLPFEFFLDGIEEGKWQDFVHPVRICKTREDRDKLKKKAPAVTVAGLFDDKHTDQGIEKHSTFLCMDIDPEDNPEMKVEELKQLLKTDKYVVAAFLSISGLGLCIILHIAPAKHKEAFQGACQYFNDTYGIICDPTSINPSRLRFVSYDPNILRNRNYDKFCLYPKEKPPKKIDKIIYAKDDFESIIKEICNRRINLVEDYYTWLRCGFAIAHKFGTAGEEYFHLISQFSPKYDRSKAAKQYSSCVKHKDTNEATIATLYYHCKNANIPLYSERTIKIANSASQGKKGGLSKQTVANNLKKFEEIEGAEDIIDQVFDNNIDLNNEEGEIQQLEMWLRQNTLLRRNGITRYIENNGVQIEDKDFNTFFIAAKKIFEKLPFDLFSRLINSDFVYTYNPFFEFFEENKHRTSTGNIEKFFNSIKSKDPDFTLRLGRKWLVGIISSIHGNHSPLMFVLSGKKKTSKTQFFRRMMPEVLKKYYAESKLDEAKDGPILMSQKLIIMDDEFGGKSKKDSKKLRDLLSKQYFDLREPYGKANVTLMRLAMLCGTSNDQEIIDDPENNRRIIAILTTGTNHELYNSVCKEDLWMEAYRLYKDNFDCELSEEEIELLEKDHLTFEMLNMEKELIQKWFEPGNTELLTATDIKVFLEQKTGQRLILTRIGNELKSLGFEQRKVNNSRVYPVNQKSQLFEILKEDLPF